MKTIEALSAEFGNVVKAGNSGFVSMLASRGGSMVISLLSNAIMGRLLLPSDYGLVAMASVLLSLLNLLRDFGLSTAIIQRSGLSASEVDLVYWVNMGIGVGCFAIGCLIAPLISTLYSQPQVAAILIALSFGMLITSSTSIHAALLRRQLRFQPLMWSELLGLGAGLIVGVALAWWTRSYWAIVASGLTASAVSSLVLVVSLPWFPGKFVWSRSGLEILRFGLNLLSFSVLNFFSNMIGAILISFTGNTVVLGHYNRAQQLYSLSGGILLTPFTQVSLSVLSRLRADDGEYSAYYLELSERVALGFAILGAALIVEGHSITLILLGPNWGVAGEMLRWYGLAVISVGMAGLSGNVLVSQGRVVELKRWGFLDALLRGGGAVVGLLIAGPVGVVAGFSVSMLVVTTPLVALLISRRGPIRFSDQLKTWIGGGITATVIVTLRSAAGQLIRLEAGIQSLLLTFSCIIVSLAIVVIFVRQVRGILLQTFRVLTSTVSRRIRP